MASPLAKKTLTLDEKLGKSQFSVDISAMFCNIDKELIVNCGVQS
jgi:hypothetical protein